jgi:hypothetical protein
LKPLRLTVRVEKEGQLSSNLIMYVHKDGVALEWKFWQKSILYPSQRGLHGFARHPPVIFITKTQRISAYRRYTIPTGRVVMYSSNSLVVTGSLGSMFHLVGLSVVSVATIGDDDERISWRLLIGPRLHLIYPLTGSSASLIPMSFAKFVHGWH